MNIEQIGFGHLMPVSFHVLQFYLLYLSVFIHWNLVLLSVRIQCWINWINTNKKKVSYTGVFCTTLGYAPLCMLFTKILFNQTWAERTLLGVHSLAYRLHSLAYEGYSDDCPFCSVNHLFTHRKRGLIW